MTPERFLAPPVDRRVDVYSLACVLYEALTGRRPFLGEESAALIHAHLNLPPPAPSRHRPELAAFDEVVARGMAKDVAQRYSSAGELAGAARQALAAPREPAPVAPPAPQTVLSSVGPAPGPPPAQVAQRQPSRPSARWLALAAVLAAVPVAAVVAVGQRRGSPTSRRSNQSCSPTRRSTTGPRRCCNRPAGPSSRSSPRRRTTSSTRTSGSRPTSSRCHA